ncbi:beta-arrestin-1 isoform X5 [Nasonia vitripennis]|uniref:Arrestin C-terminal-like domain-containing protein n=2 Tax=Nasonia vitripennis TaxID=7425 RepID=A0A7M7QLD5_NASVI|nr:beta-arrestin-1 isoform X5 [Nasonia vitripennis]
MPKEEWPSSESEVSDSEGEPAAGSSGPAMDDSVNKRQATRVFKKSSPNGKITVYLGKRDFVDHISHVDPIGEYLTVLLFKPSKTPPSFEFADGVVLIDPDYVKDRKVFGHVLAAFKYGREDLDVLGLTFRKDLYLAAKQIYPVQPGTQPRELTRLQERLIKKLGSNAYPFYFELPPHCPASVTLQPAPGDTGKPCGVDYELKAFVGETQDDKPHKRNSVRLAIRKIMYAPSKQGEQPSTEVSKDFMMSPSKLHLEASLDKELYHHGENIAVNVHIANNSNRTVKKIKVSVRQFADICLFSTAQYKCTVAEAESDIGVAPGFTLSKVFSLKPTLADNKDKRGLALDGQLKHEDTNLASSTMEGCPVGPGFTLSKVFSLTPLLANNKDKWGLALDGQLKHEDTNLASSTLVADPSQRENLGIIVQYKVKVKLCLGALAGELVAELPFILMHPKPEEEEPAPSTARPSPTHKTEDGVEDTNLIQLDEEADGDDIIFEDFARLRLKGETDA